LNGSVELGVLAFPEAKRGLTVVNMPSNRLVVVCPPDHKFAKKKQVRARDLNGMDMVLFERDTPTRKATDKSDGQDLESTRCRGKEDR
jgi:DNA-binding transcriptional LysR family regulator